jgi:hypothetical protein
MVRECAWRPFLAVLCLALAGCDENGGVADAGGDGDAIGAEIEEDVPVDPGDVPGSDADAGEDEAAGDDGDAGPPFELDPHRIHDDIAFLASEACAGREAATPGNDLALDYVEGLFEEIGLEPAGDSGTYRQRFEFPKWTLRSPPAAELAGEALVSGENFVVFRYSGSGTVAAPVVFVGYGLVVPPFDRAEYPDCPLDPAGFDDYAGVDADGKAVLSLQGLPRDDLRIGRDCPGSPPDKVAIATAHGAAAVVTVANYRTPPEVVWGITLWWDRPGTIPVVMIDRTLVETLVPGLPAWAAGIDERLAPSSHGTDIDVSVEVDAEVATVASFNLLGAIPGVDPGRRDEVVVVGGHIDHEPPDPVSGTIYPGADDNASGTAMTVELARAVAGGVGRPARTVLFAAWNAEEQGILGSCAYVASPAYELAATRALLNMDAVGGGTAGGLYLFGGASEPNSDLTRLMIRSMLAHGIDGSVQSVSDPSRSDHKCFADNGVPILSAMSLHDERMVAHTPGDTIGNINIDDLDLAGRMIWAALEPLARGTEAEYVDE